TTRCRTRYRRRRPAPRPRGPVCSGARRMRTPWQKTNMRWKGSAQGRRSRSRRRRMRRANAAYGFPAGANLPENAPDPAADRHPRWRRCWRWMCPGSARRGSRRDVQSHRRSRPSIHLVAVPAMRGGCCGNPSAQAARAGPGLPRRRRVQSGIPAAPKKNRWRAGHRVRCATLRAAPRVRGRARRSRCMPRWRAVRSFPAPCIPRCWWISIRAKSEQRMRGYTRGRGAFAAFPGRKHMLRTRITKWWVPLLLTPALLLLMAFRQVPLTDPAAIPVPNGVNSAKVERIIGSALTARNWRIVKHVPGEIDAVYDPRAFSVTIAVHYDSQKIQINYVTSSNLRYEEKNGVRYIHTNYESWIKNLVTDIQNGLMMAK